MVKWIIEFKGEPYAVFIFDKELKLQRQSTQAIKDKLKEKVLKDLTIFDPRHAGLKNVDIKNLKDEYEADIFLKQLFTPHSKPEFTIESQELDWGKVMKKPKPGIFY